MDAQEIQSNTTRKGRAKVMCPGICLQSCEFNHPSILLSMHGPRQMILFHSQILIYNLLYFKLLYAFYYVMKDNARFFIFHGF